jgi:hypothetical protein
MAIVSLLASAASFDLSQQSAGRATFESPTIPAAGIGPRAAPTAGAGRTLPSGMLNSADPAEITEKIRFYRCFRAKRRL